MSSKKKTKKPKYGASVNPTKKPKLSDPTIADKRPLAWRFSSCDKNGAYAWTSLAEPKKHKEVIEKLHDFEGMTREEIAATGSHSIPIEKLEKTATQRLEQIQRDDLDELMSFRLQGANRVFCIQEKNIMKVLWWDPDHKVCRWPPDPADRRKNNRRR